MIKKFITSTVLLGSLFCSTSSAFDGKKEGFMVSVGAGLATVHTNFKKDYKGWSGIESDDSGGFATSLKIGYNFLDRYSVYIIHSASFTEYDKDPKNDVYGNCMFGIGTNYYLEPNGSTYIMTAIGLGRFTNTSNTSEEDIGSAFMIGMGNEIYPHINIEGSYVGTRVNDNGVDVNSDSFHVTLNYYWY